MLSAIERAWLRDDVAAAAGWLGLAADALPSDIETGTLVGLAMGTLAAQAILGPSVEPAARGALVRLRARSCAGALHADPTVLREFFALAGRLGVELPLSEGHETAQPEPASPVIVDDILFGDESIVARVCLDLESTERRLDADVGRALSARAYAELRRRGLLLGTRIVRLQLRRGYDREGALDAVRFLRTQQRTAGHFGGDPTAASAARTPKRSVSEVVNTALVLVCYDIALALAEIVSPDATGRHGSRLSGRAFTTV